MRFRRLSLRQRRIVRIAAAMALLLFAAMFSYSCGVQRRMNREILAADRDPMTGVVRGTEAITLRPEKGKELTPTTCVLMIHGFMSARSDYADLPERLVERGFTVRLMRLPGHGTTPIELGNLAPGVLYSAVEREYMNLYDDYDRFYVVGFSMGGALATLLASRERVDRLVLLAPYYAVTHKWYYVLPAMAWSRLVGWAVPYMSRSEEFIKINDRSQIGKYFMYETLPMGGVHRLDGLGREASRPETLRKVRCPVLLIHSVGDEASSPEAARRAFDQFASPRKQSMWLKRSNHVILWDYEREEVKRRIEMFLLDESLGR